MRITVTLLVLAVALGAPCGKGGLQCDQGSCHYPAYLEGCLTYAPDDSCAACEYSTPPFMQTTSSTVEDASTPPIPRGLTAAHSSMPPLEHAFPARGDSSSVLRRDCARRGRSKGVW
jgi:hypothetical protein